jgi:hypothetical protein
MVGRDQRDHAAGIEAEPQTAPFAAAPISTTLQRKSDEPKLARSHVGAEVAVMAVAASSFLEGKRALMAAAVALRAVNPGSL